YRARGSWDSRLGWFRGPSGAPVPGAESAGYSSGIVADQARRHSGAAAVATGPPLPLGLAGFLPGDSPGRPRRDPAGVAAGDSQPPPPLRLDRGAGPVWDRLLLGRHGIGILLLVGRLL